MYHKKTGLNLKDFQLAKIDLICLGALNINCVVVNHVEGGWPKEFEATDREMVLRY